MLNNRMYCGINRRAYFQERKAYFAQTLFKSGLSSRMHGLFSEAYGTAKIVVEVLVRLLALVLGITALCVPLD